MKKIHFIGILILTLLTSCKNNSDFNLDGDWLGYQLTSQVDNKLVNKNYNNILSFIKDTITSRYSEYTGTSFENIVTKNSYHIYDSLLIIKNTSHTFDTLRIIKKTNSELVLSSNNNQFSFFRLQNIIYKKYPLDIVNKSFVLSDSIQDLENIEFINRELALIYDDSLLTEPEICKWEINSFKQYNFLTLSSRRFPVFLVTAIDNKYTLKLHPNSNQKYYLTTNNKSRSNIDNIIGVWKSKTSNTNKELRFKISLDSIETNDLFLDTNLSLKHYLNPNNNMIVIPYHEKFGCSIYYKIVYLNKDSLVLSRLSIKKEIITLKKTN